MSGNQSKEYIKLRDKWYKKLKETGFKEIEDTAPGQDRLLQWSQSGLFGSQQRFQPEVLDARRAYYTMAEHFLNSHKFKTKRDKFIWQLHSEGKSLRIIGTELKKHRFKGGKDAAEDTVVRLKKVMEQDAKDRSNSNQEL